MKNINELRNELSDNFKKLKDGEMDVPVVAELNNTAGKMIQTIAMEIKQAEMLESKEMIPFLIYDEKQLPSKEVKELAS